MSTILKTLKKIEEEKSVLEKKMDLEKLVLQDEESFYPAHHLKALSRYLWSGVLFLAGLSVIALWLWADEFHPAEVSQLSPSRAVRLSPSVPVKKQNRPSVPGVPLSNIPDPLRAEPVVGSNYRTAEKKIPEKSGAEPVKPVSRLAGGTVRQEQSIYEIQSLIASAKSVADEPEEGFVPPLNNNLSIPGLKVKGVIFFSPGSPSNHIFVSTPENSNQKIRVGDSIGSAALLKIDSSGAVFSYQGERVHLKIGG